MYYIFCVGPRAESLPNGDGGLFDQGDGEMSPPAKKTTPSFMMPLPGMAARVMCHHTQTCLYQSYSLLHLKVCVEGREEPGADTKCDEY